MHSDIKEILVTEEQIDKIVKEIAEKIDRDYRGRDKKLLLLCILKGSVVFMGEIMKHVTIPVEIDFMKVSSYGSGTTSGRLNIILDLHRDNLPDTDIIIIEDIIDSGKTLAYLKKYLELKGANSVRTCTLLDKPSRREVDLVPDYTGCEIPDEFVVGFGLDYDEKYRNLPFVGILKPEVYSN
jgi:hypoxanthine phosphoribosyltransferase